MKTETLSKTQHVAKATAIDQGVPAGLAIKAPSALVPFNENLRELFINKAVETSECGPTEFVSVQNKYLMPLINDLYAVFGPAVYADMFYLYMDLNLYAAYFDTSEQYFGENGEYTNLIKKRKRDLEKFWDMPNQIQINGQHTATLNDREKLADVFEIAGVDITTREQALAAADQILYLNTLSPYLPESPFFAIDGFATTYRNLIVIGDGIVEMLSETGVEEDIVWTGILAHEWAHQIQFKNMGAWYPDGIAADPAEATRYMELEADFLAAYYMTHKRGATFNKKRVEEFLTLFFQIGDCGFDSDSHHGTPLQRMAAARLGFELADQAQKQGHILTPQQAHQIFVARIHTVL
ncbi:neutral zinc metallopeptidase [Pontibacter beigongshangensis]|uniref:hypothetical protein n=1 Tax=Pontibacter beigongshangensis TaxID=2574733 RepID=UPI00164F801F|nr:hypothetical protein [Pontibacter beigongshangensis]